MKNIVALVICLSLNLYTYSQNLNTITTAVPFLLINPNAQSTGIGDIGVVAATNYYESGLTQNPALLSRNEKVVGFKISYKPWIRHLASDINLFDAGFYYSINKKITLGYSFNLFSLGQHVYMDQNGTKIEVLNPKELYHQLRYAQSLSPNFSMGVGLKYVVSDLTNNMTMNGIPTHTGKALAGDIGLDYRKEFAKKETSFWRYDFGASILNIGNKVRYTDFAGDFLPMQLELGTMWTYHKDITPTTRYCIDLAYQLEKLLVPTPPIYSTDANGKKIIVAGKDPNVSVIQGAIQSFYDAPDGGSEELREIVHKVGIENRFVFNKESSIALRTGILNESKWKGNRKYVNVGLGGKYKFIYLDLGMILFYKWDNIGGQTAYTSGIRRLYSYNINLGFIYTFKEKV